MTQIPKDPSDQSSYIYGAASSTYILGTVLENNKNAALNQTTGNTNGITPNTGTGRNRTPTPACTKATAQYCVQP
jgi:hypothetical protein